MNPTIRKVNPKSSDRISSSTEKTNGRNLRFFPSAALSLETISNSTTTNSTFVSDNGFLQQFPITLLCELNEYLMNPTIRTRLPQPAPSTVKRNELKTPRPKNSFMIFRMDVQYFLLAKSPGLNHKDISRVAGSMWKSAPEKLKNLYRKKSSWLKVQHRQRYPDYKFSPKKKSLKTKAKKSGKIEARHPVTILPSSEDTNIKENITSNTTNDDYDNCSCSLSVSDADTVSVKEELMNVYGFGYETANFDTTGFYTPLQYIPYANHINIISLTENLWG